MTNAAIKNAICEAVIDPGDGAAALPLEYVLIRGFSVMGWKLPATAAGDMIDAIADRIIQQIKKG